MKDLRRIKPNNEGITLVELIVVILIMSIVSAGAVIGISTVYNARVDNAAKRLETMILYARETAMANAGRETKLTVSVESGDLVAKVYVGDAAEPVETEKLGSDAILVDFYLTADGRDPSEGAAAKTSVHVTEVNDVTLRFDQSSGGIKAEATGTYTDVNLRGSESINLILIPENGRVVRSE